MTGTWCLTIAVVVSAFLAQGAVSPVPPRNRPACRTVAASVTSESVSGAGRTLQISTGRFDRAARRWITESVLSDSSGRRTRERTVTQYALIDDFIDEASVVPPLKRYQTSVTTGPAHSTTNTYDEQRRLLRFTTVTPTGPGDAVAYSAWDAYGRPTAGTRTGATSRGTLAIVYDNTARTMTTTTITPTPDGPLRFVNMETFDEHGNVLRFDLSTPTGSATTINMIQKTEAICREAR